MSTKACPLSMPCVRSTPPDPEVFSNTSRSLKHTQNSEPPSWPTIKLNQSSSGSVDIDITWTDKDWTTSNVTCSSGAVKLRLAKLRSSSISPNKDSTSYLVESEKRSLMKHNMPTSCYSMKSPEEHFASPETFSDMSLRTPRVSGQEVCSNSQSTGAEIPHWLCSAPTSPLNRSSEESTAFRQLCKMSSMRGSGSTRSPDHVGCIDINPQKELHAMIEDVDSTESLDSVEILSPRCVNAEVTKMMDIHPVLSRTDSIWHLPELPELPTTGTECPLCNPNCLNNFELCTKCAQSFMCCID